MKIFAFVMLLVSAVAFGGYSGSPKTPQAGRVVDAGVNAIPQAYDTSVGSQLYSLLPSTTAFDLCNTTAVDIALKVDVTIADCNGATGDNYYIPAGFCLSKQNISIGKAICQRSLGAVINADLVYISVD